MGSTTRREAGRVDRRITRTKKLLSEAFMPLILEKGYEAVTIQNIIDRADVGRSTFYAHFESKEQLLFSGQEQLQQMLFGAGDSTRTGIDFLLLYRHAAQNFPVAKAMLGKKGGHLIIDHIRQVMTYKIMSEAKKQKPSSETKQPMFSFLAEALSAGLVRLLTCWLDADMPLTPEAMAAQSDKLLNSVLHHA